MDSILINTSTLEISQFHLSSNFQLEYQLQSCTITKMYKHHQKQRLDTRFKLFSTLTVEKNSNTNSLLWFMSLQQSLLLDMNKSKKRSYHLAALTRVVLLFSADSQRMFSTTTSGLELMSLLTTKTVSQILLRLSFKFAKIFI